MPESVEKKIIVSNQVECLKCGDRPWSASIHDFRKCDCGNVSVDGGVDYKRRLFNDSLDSWRDISIVLPENTVASAIVAVIEAQKTGRNARGIAYAVMRALRDNGIQFPNE